MFMPDVNFHFGFTDSVLSHTPTAFRFRNLKAGLKNRIDRGMGLKCLWQVKGKRINENNTKLTKFSYFIKTPIV